mgnify:CR=1 FL=1|jgi:hypothetical protein
MLKIFPLLCIYYFLLDFVALFLSGESFVFLLVLLLPLDRFLFEPKPNSFKNVLSRFFLNSRFPFSSNY